ncbi:MAG TPA: hypothetical protein VGR26_00900 [Acidimicrobiales bacterium]|nr:hypothetical protein [Acidimicrobiales bacterium]
MYDYVDGKSDWMAFGLPVEGEEGPFAASAVVDAATCGPDEPAREVAGRLAGAGADEVVVVNDGGVVLGVAGAAELEEAAPSAVVATVMRLSPSTVRPSVLLSSLAGGDAPVLVTDPDGVLLGVVMPSAPPEESDEESDEEARLSELQGTFLEVAHAVEEHFADHDPSEEEVRAFLHERLVAEGRSPEEAEAYLAAMEDPSG